MHKVKDDSLDNERPSKDSLHPDYIPSIFPHRPKSQHTAEHSLKRYKRHKETASKRSCTKRLPFEDPEGLDVIEDFVPLEEAEGLDVIEDFVPLEEAASIITQTDSTNEQEIIKSLHDEINNLREEKEDAITQLEEMKKKYRDLQLSSSAIQDNDAKSHFYTGLTWAVFLQTFYFLSSHGGGRTKESLPFIDQFFLTLVRLRMDLSFEFISDIAGCGETTVRDYFWKWIDVMYAKLSFLVRWPDRDAAAETLPPEFKVLYPRLTGIVDCFEIFIGNAGNLLARQQTYSNYKKHTTAKVFVACSPLGAITYISMAWGGRVSDVELVRRSGFMSPNLHLPHDQILADRGFTLQDDFAVNCGVELVIPAFTRGKKQLPAADVEISRQMSSIRIHVERVIGLLKKRYAILQGTLPIQMIKTLKDEADQADEASIDRLLRVCAALVNLGGSIVFKG
ncbi:PREDICTED: uncharacterized protein LOC106814985 isoform X2 [Priapulus caudatus]|uniref:Uncharacterized protein LOC106814985 isoform X2 n=1 Tax=Priapulus caudatus TaxID=37621 RepID=A0ABM1ERQ2_PRICU|nr:PREDICTED: uncharacterized protein LOC106814985 isoform X2 [Priapulus caudatus]